jgi:hypothetical protein
MAATRARDLRRILPPDPLCYTSLTDGSATMRGRDKEERGDDSVEERLAIASFAQLVLSPAATDPSCRRTPQMGKWL